MVPRMAHRFPRAALATIQLGRPVEDFISERRANGDSFRKIANDLSAATDGATDVTDMTVRTWHLAAEAARETA